jgi:chromosome segregation ATPase
VVAEISKRLDIVNDKVTLLDVRTQKFQTITQNLGDHMEEQVATLSARIQELESERDRQYVLIGKAVTELGSRVEQQDNEIDDVKADINSFDKAMEVFDQSVKTLEKGFNDLANVLDTMPTPDTDFVPDSDSYNSLDEEDESDKSADL